MGDPNRAAIQLSEAMEGIRAQSGASDTPAGRPDTILCVDDNESNRYVRNRLLRSEGFEVIEAVNGADALRLAAGKQLSLVLLDIQLPDINGFAVCRRLKSNPKTSLIPVLHISSPGKRNHDYPEALESGGEAYLQEPVEPPVLLAVIRALIRAARAEARARKTERDAVDILESIGDAMYLLDQDYRFTYVNAEAERLIGVERGVLTGKTHAEVFPESIGTTVDREYRRVMTGRTPSSFENFCEPWQRWYEVKANPVSGGGIAVHFREITGRKEAEEERQRLVRDLTERTGELQAILDAAPVAVWIAHDPQCLRITGNAYADQAIMRVPRDGNISRSAMPDDAAASYRAFRNGVELRPEELPAQVAISTGKPIMDQELDLLFDDGRTLSLLAGAVPLFDAEGHVRGSVVAGTDVTQLRRVEEALRESEERFRDLADGCPAIIWMADAEGRNRFVNRTYREFFGVTYDQVEGHQWQPLIHPDDEPEYTGAVLRAVRERAPIRAEARVRRADGEWRWIESYGEPRFSPSGEFIGHAGISSDITERKRAEGMLRESQRRYHTLFDSIDEGFCIVEVIFDENEKPIDYRFLEVNQSFENHTGLINAKGKRMRELEPEHEEYWFQIYGQIALTGQPARFQNRAEQLQRWYDVYASRFGASEKRQVAILFSDITERKRAEQALRESEARYRTLFSKMSEGFALGEAICDADGRPIDFRFIDVNHGFERQSGLTRGILGKPMREVLPNLEQVWVDTYCRTALTGESVRFDQYNRDTNR